MDQSAGTPGSLKQEEAESVTHTQPAIYPSTPETTAATNDVVPSTEGMPNHLSWQNVVFCDANDGV